MQVDDICLLKLRQACNVCACIGYIDCEKIVLLKAVGFPDDNAFPHKPPYLPPVTLQTYYADLVGVCLSRTNILALIPLFFNDSIKRLAATAAPPKRSEVLIIKTLIRSKCFGKSSGFR